MGAISKASATRAISPAQSTAISFVDDHGDAITITSDDVRMHICPQADAKEVAYFMELCRAQRLNPFLNEAYLVKFQGKPAQIMVAHKALVKRAESHPQYDGMRHGINVINAKGEFEKREGSVIRSGKVKPNGEIENAAGTEAYCDKFLIGGWCEIRRKDRGEPVYVERGFMSMNKGQANWNNMPDVMIDKCAQAAALREAFPDELRGMYVTEEMGQAVPAAGVTVEPATALTGQVAYVKPTTLSDEDKRWMKEATATLTTMGYDFDEVRRYLWETYKAKGMDAARAWYESQVNSKAENEVESEVVDVDTQEVENVAETAPTASEIVVEEEPDPFAE